MATIGVADMFILYFISENISYRAQVCYAWLHRHPRYARGLVRSLVISSHPCLSVDIYLFVLFFASLSFWSRLVNE